MSETVEVVLRLNLEHLECIYADLGMYNTMTGDCERPGHDCGSKKLRKGICDILCSHGYPHTCEQDRRFP